MQQNKPATVQVYNITLRTPGRVSRETFLRGNCDIFFLVCVEKSFEYNYRCIQFFTATLSIYSHICIEMSIIC